MKHVERLIIGLVTLLIVAGILGLIVFFFAGGLFAKVVIGVPLIAYALGYTIKESE